MDEEDIDIEEHDVLDNPRIRDIFPDLARVKIERHSDDEQSPNENDHDFDMNNQPGSSLDNQYHQVTDTCNIVIKQEYGEYEYLSDCNDIDEVDNFDQVDNIDQTNNIDRADTIIVPDNIDNDFNDNVDGSDNYVDQADNINIDNDFNNIENQSDNIEQVSDFEHVNSDIISSHASDVEIISSDTEYHIPNKIILGTKIIMGSKIPSQKKEVGKEYQKAIVLLEDWSQNLHDSGCFCESCEILFATPNALDAHKMSIHSFLVAVPVNKARKSTAKCNYARKPESSNREVAKKSTGGSKLDSKFCNHCNMTFPDHTSLIKHLYELLPIKQFNCSDCNFTCNTQNELNIHSVKHKELPNPKLVKVSKDLGTKFPKIAEVKSSHADWFAVNRNDNKFKCTLCSEIFHNYNSCKKHRDSTHPGTKNFTIFTKLKVKKRKSDALDDKIEDNSVMIPKSSLFQCKNCKLNFLSGFTAVLHKVCNVLKNFWQCDICKRKFRNEDQHLHRKQHEVNARFKVYLIVSDLYHRILCRCSHCSLHFEEKQFKPHMKYCRKIPKEICTICKILLPKSRLAEHNKKHVFFHYQPTDFFILNYITEKHKQKDDADVDETVNKRKKLTENDHHRNTVEIYYCKNCKCCISSKKTKIFKTHAANGCSKTNSKICKECGLYFTIKAISSHSQYHSERNITIRDIKMVDLETMKVIAPVIPNYPQCATCKINFFSIEAMNDHICGEDYETCEFCGDRYHNSAYEIHRQFHDVELPRTETTNTTDAFKVTKTEVKIMPELIKKYESLKMMWNVLFLCKICDINTDSYDKCVEHSQCHIAQRNMQEQSIKCYICNLKLDETSWSKHADLHARMKITNEDFKLLTFDPRILVTEAWFQMFESLPEKQINQIIDGSVYGGERRVKMKLVKPGRSEFTLYTCANCGICFEQDAISRHVADKCRHSANVCLVCNIAFEDILNLRQHENLHEKGIDKNEFRIVSFNLPSGSEVNDMGQNSGRYKQYTVYKCVNCHVCVLLRHSLRRHQCGKNIQKFCNICNQKYAYQSIPKHNAKHKQDPNFKAMNIKIELFRPPKQALYSKITHKIPVKMNKLNIQKSSNLIDYKMAVNRDQQGRIMLYKCSDCQVCFIMQTSAENHRCHITKYVFNCKICKEKFGTNTKPRHQGRHKLDPNFKANNFIINHFKPKTRTNEAVFTIKPQKIREIRTREIKEEIMNQSSVKPLGYETTLRFKHRNVTFFGLNEINRNKKKYIRYHCINCNLTMIRASLRAHKCPETVNRKKYRCNICSQIILNTRKTDHLRKHVDYPDFTSENILIIKFKSRGVEQDENVKEQDVEYPSGEEADSQNEEEKFLKDHSEKYKVLKCVDCNMSRDIKTCRNTHVCMNDARRKYRCKICGLIILSCFKAKHTIKHNLNPHFRKGNLEIIPFKPNNSTSEKLSYEASDENYDGDADESMNVDFNQYDEENSVELQEINVNKHKYVQYECTLCKRNLIDKRNVKDHNCTLKKQKGNLDFFCRICKRHYPMRLKLKHKLRHDTQPDYNTDNIKVVPFCNDKSMVSNDKTDDQEIENISKKKYKYIQYECTICKTNLLEKKSLREHYCTRNKSKFHCKTFFCDICKLSYSNKIQTKHEVRHRLRPDYKADTIKVVPFSNINDDDNDTVDLASSIDDQEMNHQVAIDDQKFENIGEKKYKYKQYECTMCKGNLICKKKIKEHNCTSEKNKNHYKTFFCKICKLSYSIGHQIGHKLRHKKRPDYKAGTIKVVPFCNINDYEIVSIDGDDTANLASSIDIDDQDIDLQASIDDQEMESIDEKKYKYTQYECTICKGNVLEKKAAKNHNCTSKSRMSRYKKFFCDICQLFYSQKFQSNHELRHRNLPDYKAGTIKVVPFCNKKDYDIVSIDGDDTANPASSIDIDDQDIDLQASIDDQAMESIDENKYKYIQYECTICKGNVLEKKTAKNHNCTSKSRMCRYKKFFCDICQLFYSLKFQSNHELRHKNLPDYKADTIKVVPFCNKNDDESVVEDDTVDLDSSMDVDQESEVQKVIDNVKNTINRKRPKYIQFECIICKVNLIYTGSKFVEITHDCTKTKKLFKTFYCNICKRTYFNKTMHLIRHKKYRHYNADTIEVVPFDPKANQSIMYKYDHKNRSKPKTNATFKTKKNKKSVWRFGEIPKRKHYTKREVDKHSVSTIYKCDCGLHFTSKTSADNHIEICNDDLNISKENCSKCGLLFPTDVLVTHLCKHHSKDIQINVETISKPDDSHELILPDVIETNDSHVINDDPLSDDVDIKTDGFIIDSHDSNDNNDQEVVADDMEVIENDISTDLIQNEPQPSTSRTKPDLYKCSECNVYYISANTCLKHVKYHEKLDPKQYIECKLCGLQFTFMTLMTHMKKHHEAPFDVDKIVVEVYHPGGEGLPLKKELFCASDRLQSLLVSSSNDEGCSSTTN